MTSFNRLLLGVAYTGFSFFAHGAYAQGSQETGFYPIKSWEVATAKPVSDYSGECVIQTEFNNGFLMQMNGSSNWVQLLNLNIRQDAFEIGQNYDVTLTVPGRDTQTIRGQARSTNIISVSLKGQKELYKAMRDYAVLDINIEGNDFRFNLTGFSSSAKEFERCMAGATPGEVAATAGSRDNKTDLDGISVSSSDLNVSTKDMSDKEKDFLLNESIAFEQDEVAVVDAPIAAPVAAVEPIAVEPVAAKPVEDVQVIETAIVELPIIEENVGEGVPAQEIAMPDEINDAPAPAVAAVEKKAAITEEDAVAALNASAAEAARKRLSMISARQTKPAPQAIAIEPTPVESVETPLEPLESKDLVEPIVDKTSSNEEEILTPAADMGSPEEEIVVEIEAKLPGEVYEDSNAMTASLLAEPERSIDMPKMIVNKEISNAGTVDMRRFAEPNIEDADSVALARVVALENELNALKKQNDALNEELEVSLKEGQKEQTVVASENWNLERATMRYNEAEHQLKKLGQQLQKERAQCSMETKELETMLFDPEVTSQEQLARLSALERELEEAKSTIAALKGDMKSQ